MFMTYCKIKMIEENTERLVCRSEMQIKDGKLIEPINDTLDILNLKPNTGMEYGFMFYNKINGEWICQIHFEIKRREFEISYGTKENYQGKGYMKEALNFFVHWIFENTSIEKMYALINDNSASKHILEITGFEYEQCDECGEWFVITRDNC